MMKPMERLSMDEQGIAGTEGFDGTPNRRGISKGSPPHLMRH